MKKINLVFLFIAGLIFIFGAQDLYAGEAGARYSEAVRCIKAKQPDFAFMEFRSIIRDFPKSSFAQKSIFAMAEYYYDHGMYYDAIANFTGYINDYPGSKANVFAKAYLLKIMEEIKDPSWEEKRMLENAKRDFFSKPLFLLFKEYKETSYRSALWNKFRIRYYIDNVEVYRNGQLFVNITP
jgi:outer membrane protein assembly factor BamD (BamD/ComL family)